MGDPNTGRALLQSGTAIGMLFKPRGEQRQLAGRVLRGRGAVVVKVNPKHFPKSWLSGGTEEGPGGGRDHRAPSELIQTSCQKKPHPSEHMRTDTPFKNSGGVGVVCVPGTSGAEALRTEENIVAKDSLREIKSPVSGIFFPVGILRIRLADAPRPPPHL